MIMKQKILFLAFLITLIGLNAKATVIRVDSSNTSGFQDGSEWQYAYSNLQMGINAANSGDSIWVAKAIYFGTLGAPISMKEGVKIFGGFLATHVSFSQRNPGTNVTIISRIKNDANNLTQAALLDGFTFTGSKSNEGGAIYNYQTSPAINNCIFYRDSTTAGGRGGAMYNKNANPLITNCTFSENVAVHANITMGQGAAIYNLYSSPTIISCVFTNNLNTRGYGGAIFNDYSFSPNIINCTFTGNRANYGGAIYSDASSSSYSLLTVNNCTFTANIAYADPSTMYGEGGAMCTLDAALAVSNCTFTANHSFGTGGALANSGAYGSIKFCNMTGNRASSYGGAVYNFLSTPKITNCIIAHDTARIGGGIYNSTSDGDSLINLLIIKNVADTLGGGICNTGSGSPKIINCVVSGNRSAYGGGGIYSQFGASSLLINSILWGNNTGVLNDNSSTTSATYSLIQGFPANSTLHNLAGTIDPLFIDTAVNDFHLQNISPCQDAGNSVANPLLVDLDANNRHSGLAIDMGVYEYSGVPLPVSGLILSANLQLDNQVRLQWKCYDRSTNIFELQHSSDGITFIPINYGSAFYTGDKEFSFTHKEPQALNFYRIIHVDADGHKSYSNVVQISIEKMRTNSCIYPNPADDNLFLKISDKTLLKSEAQLLNTYGQIIKIIYITDTVQQISLMTLNKGFYILKLTNGEILQFIKK